MTAIASLLDLPVTEAEIHAACASVGLPPKAFHGNASSDTRLDVLRTNSSIDVAACPGSGKTTLLVAKLAILSKRWSSAWQGVCVLSHTNVARLEIEKRLGLDPAGRALVSYPHFVGTIHAFVNTFVALPWLRSQGIDVVAIDNEICLRRRWNELGKAQQNAVKSSNRDEELLRIVDPDHDLGEISWGGGKLGKQTALYLAFVKACRAATHEGFFCHDDMLIWAGQALDQNPQIQAAVRSRFPILFLDEVQDNSEAQSLLLRRLFIDGDKPSVRQRFGDMNQAIYENARDNDGANSDWFPDPTLIIPVSNSHRFGSQIAGLANPLAIDPPGLIGLREHNDHGKQAAILLFDPAERHSILPAFADLLTSRFEPADLATGPFAAIGAIHRDKKSDDAPNCVAHYWSGYDDQLARIDGRPRTLIGYMRHGLVEAGPSGDLRPITERAADGLLRLVSLLNPSVRHPYSANRHRQCLRLLEHDQATTKRYKALCWKLAKGELATTAAAWQAWRNPMLDIAMAILGNPAAIENADAFLAWEDERSADGVVARHGNVFVYPALEPAVRIKVGSIHSVKGETHLATLVFDTFYKGSHLKRIKDWLIGTKAGVADNIKKPDLRKSLKQHYVAVTRPSHLLCLAMRKDAFTDAELDKMRARHWEIGDVVDQKVVWRE